MNGYKNSEGYSDPTPGVALGNMAYEEKQNETERLQAVSMLIPVIHKTAELVGFEVVGRITLLDKKTGKKYK